MDDLAGRRAVASGVAEELLQLLAGEDHAEDRLGAAVQLFGLGRGEETIEGLARLVQEPAGECRTRAAVQLGRIGAAALPALPALMRAVVDREDDGLALAAIEALNTIDPENLIGPPQLVRLLRRRVLKMWRAGAFVRVSADETMIVRLVRALQILWPMVRGGAARAVAPGGDVGWRGVGLVPQGPGDVRTAGRRARTSGVSALLCDNSVR